MECDWIEYVILRVVAVGVMYLVLGVICESHSGKRLSPLSLWAGEGPGCHYWLVAACFVYLGTYSRYNIHMVYT